METPDDLQFLEAADQLRGEADQGKLNHGLLAWLIRTRDMAWSRCHEMERQVQDLRAWLEKAENARARGTTTLVEGIEKLTARLEKLESQEISYSVSVPTTDEILARLANLEAKNLSRETGQLEAAQPRDHEARILHSVTENQYPGYSPAVRKRQESNQSCTTDDPAPSETPSRTPDG